jgi:hypothetical protein
MQDNNMISATLSAHTDHARAFVVLTMCLGVLIA